jgi:ribosomal protein L22
MAEEKHEHKHEEKKPIVETNPLKNSVNGETKPIETKKEEIKEEKKTEKKEEAKVEIKHEKKEEKKPAKEKAIVNGSGLRISSKSSFAICKVIRGQTPDYSISFLEKVVKKKVAVPMNNMEIPHRKGNIMAGRYPVDTAKEFITLLKQLKANASVNGIENPIITLAYANFASMPYKRGGRKSKRTNVFIEVKDRNKVNKPKAKEKKSKIK